MRISTKGRYALRLLVDLAGNETGGYISLKEVAERQEISMKYLEQIVSLLTRAGMLHSVRGPQGGYKLAHAPASYTVGQVLRCTEGSLEPVACLADPAMCRRCDGCVTRPFWQGLSEQIANYVDSVTLEDLLHANVAAELALA